VAAFCAWAGHPMKAPTAIAKPTNRPERSVRKFNIDRTWSNILTWEYRNKRRLSANSSARCAAINSVEILV
jgi:hypothetical protein